MDTAAGALGLEVFKILFCFISVVLGLRCYAQAFSCGFLLWASLGAQLVKNPPAVQETRVLSLGWENPLEEEMATHSSIVSWKIP